MLVVATSHAAVSEAAVSIAVNFVFVESAGAAASFVAVLMDRTSDAAAYVAVASIAAFVFAVSVGAGSVAAVFVCAASAAATSVASSSDVGLLV